MTKISHPYFTQRFEEDKGILLVRKLKDNGFYSIYKTNKPLYEFLTAQQIFDLCVMMKVIEVKDFDKNFTNLI
jgi:hypothetical protein